MDHDPVKRSRSGGILVLDKPTGLSSAGAVERVKRELGVQRAGHGGTLDPLATGVLPICLDEATKLAAYLLNDDKEYEAELVLGIETDTLDRTGTVTATRSADGVTEAAVRAALVARTGEHDQIPPMYSAIKQGGHRLYKQARRGEHVERTPRRVRIDRIELRAIALPRVTIAIACGKGTYIRSLVADLGTDLGCGAHLAELRRTRSGAFTIADAQPFGAFDLSRIVPIKTVLRLPRVIAAELFVSKILSGLQLPVETFAEVPAVQFQLVDEAGELIAIAHADAGKIIYDRVFPRAT